MNIWCLHIWLTIYEHFSHRFFDHIWRFGMFIYGHHMWTFYSLIFRPYMKIWCVHIWSPYMNIKIFIYGNFWLSVYECPYMIKPDHHIRYHIWTSSPVYEDFVISVYEHFTVYDLHIWTWPYMSSYMNTFTDEM